MSNQMVESVSLVNYDTTTNEYVESDVLNPVVFSSDNKFCRFELEPKGFLSPDSTISIGVKPNSAVSRAVFPKGIGVYSLIQRAVLKTSSGRVINDTDQVGKQMSLWSMFHNAEGNKDREQFTTGRGLSYGLNYGTNGQSATSYGLANGKEYNDVSGLTANNFEVISKDRTALSPTFQIHLHEIFPFLKAGQRIPLYMLGGGDRIQIELHFSAVKDARVVLSDDDKAQTGADFLIDQNSVQMISDHIFIPGGMDKWADDHPVIQYGFTEWLMSRHTITTTTATNNLRNVGGAGRLALRVFTGATCDIPDTTDTTTRVAGDLTILNKYNALTCLRDEDKHPAITTNLFYNERYLYPQNVDNNARHFHNLKDGASKIPYTTRAIYSDEGGISQAVGEGVVNPDATAGLHYEGMGQAGNLCGHQFWLGFRLNRGERVGTKGIEIQVNYADLRDEAGKVAQYTQDTIVEVVKQAVLNKGQLDVMYG
tara:strand:- start:5018 stop:6463 length:1446 start_codon:yes stop_codon:yes gene_type:complete